MIQLDSLRAFAVLAVLLSHFTLYTRRAIGIIQLVDLAGFGVRLFFVLSGFLITGILLNSRSRCEREGISAWHTLRQFYARRFLRIFPLFYLVLAIAAFLNIPPLRETWLWHACYLTNFYLFVHGWDGSINHFWSLAVEEQFYLVWPWIIFLVARHRLPVTILLISAIGPAFRLLCCLYTHNDRTPILPLSCLDTLGAGAYLALLKHQNTASIDGGWASKRALLLGFTILGLFVILSVMQGYNVIRYVIFDLAAVLIGGALVWSASAGFKGSIGKLLQARSLTYLGTISYGIYVYHNFMPWALEKLGLHSAETVLPRTWLFDSLLMCGATIAMAALSWHCFERPINKLKRRFSY